MSETNYYAAYVNRHKIVFQISLAKFLFFTHCIRKLILAPEKSLQIFSSVFCFLPILLVSFQLFLYHKLLTVEKNSKEFVRNRKQLKRFAKIF